MANSEDSSQDRNLPASEKRLREAAARGQVARSRDLGHAALLGTFLLGIAWLGRGLFESALRTMRNGLSLGRELMLDPSLTGDHLLGLLSTGFMGMLPLLALFSLVMIAVSMVPGGFNFTWTPLEPNFSKISPMTGIGRILSKDVLVDLIKLLVFAVLLSITGGLYTWASIADFAQVGITHLTEGISLSVATVQNGLWFMLLLLIAATLVDVPLQRHRHLERLKMSLQEARDEHKESEGDPIIKSRIRQRQQQISRSRMLSDVPKADVIVTNPSHYAVAIRYDDSGMGAPTVIAKGTDHLAARIREIAAFCEIPFVESPPLARALYANVEVGREIPAVLYQAVAQILAYVYQLRHWRPGQGVMPSAPPQVEVPPGLDPNEART